MFDKQPQQLTCQKLGNTMYLYSKATKLSGALERSDGVDGGTTKSDRKICNFFVLCF